ncbi:hypothetical protein I568_01401 [Enterococcus columbae DSM 7374 = ATCC 51263]|uniref:Aminotransferase class V domain-containing protein n=2 Tax=Enterococcus columbae TaxID=1355 RepID=S1NSV3_9ENTE|nr:hypothetical protein OMW_01758 [Enterococcus columbae DSM 7374 = ATCC 51263]EOW83954.1 hypothetical protein I568_01401 [Enterococcus columbae DSM 7374 = ATCC 51263]
MSDTIRQIGFEQIPYFRTEEFSNLMLECNRLMLRFSDAPDGSQSLFLTGSGSSAMEASIMNLFNKNDRLLIVNGGNFGERFVKICKIHKIPYQEIKLEYGQPLRELDLEKYANKKYTGFLVNIHETSTGILYDLDLISDFCNRNNLFLVVDAISSFLADSFSMKKNNVQVMITASQKALACPPGIGIIVVTPEAIDRIKRNKVSSLYFDLNEYLNNSYRGQTPFTPAVSILIQLYSRLREIDNNGGVDTEISRVRMLAQHFRKEIESLPLKIPFLSLSNAITPIIPENISAYELFVILKNEYDIWVCPNGGELKDKIFRVGHIGFLNIEDNEKLILAFKDLCRRNIL